MAKKSKYQKRRAIECKIVEKSKKNPGYCKYDITIQELDGTVHTEPKEIREKSFNILYFVDGCYGNTCNMEW